MFESFRYAGSLSLEAAIRDTRSGEPRTRDDAVRQIAATLIRDLDGPVTPSRVRTHPHGPEVLAALRERLEDAIPQLRGLALVGLGQLAQPEVFELADRWLGELDDDEGTVFRRETAVIALTLLGEVTLDEDLQRRILDRLLDALKDPRPDVRFQAVLSVAERGGEAVVPALVAMLEDEEVDEVRGQLLDALAPFDPLEEAFVDRIEAVVAEASVGTETGFAGARRLAGARRDSGAAHLVAGLKVQPRRDDALEALAVIGPDLDDDAAGWLVPAITRVRAAYALTRIRPDEGRQRLTGWHKSRRRDVQDAVEDAEQALKRLDGK